MNNTIKQNKNNFIQYNNTNKHNIFSKNLKYSDYLRIWMRFRMTNSNELKEARDSFIIAYTNYHKENSIDIMVLDEIFKLAYSLGRLGGDTRI